jgi:cytochrome c biogenesis protein CcmG, thiol:disulfide interchange protein DsbE
MHDEQTPSLPGANLDRTTEASEPGQVNLIVIFLGFMLLGAALGLLLFGNDLWAAITDRPAAVVHSNETVLEQVPPLPTGGPVGAGRARTGLAIGDEALPFSLPDLDGNLVNLADYRGQPVIVNFWATWCAPCRLEMPAFQTAFEKYADQGLVILAVNQDEPAEVARAYFYDEMGLTFTPLLDDNSAIATAYGVFGLPSTYFIGPDGRVVAVHNGPLTMSQIEGYLSATFASQS